MGIVIDPTGAAVRVQSCKNHPERPAAIRGYCESCYVMGRRNGTIPLVRERGRMAECHPDRPHVSTFLGYLESEDLDAALAYLGRGR